MADVKVRRSNGEDMHSAIVDQLNRLKSVGTDSEDRRGSVPDDKKLHNYCIESKQRDEIKFDKPLSTGSTALYKSFTLHASRAGQRRDAYKHRIRRNVKKRMHGGYTIINIQKTDHKQIEMGGKGWVVGEREKSSVL